MLLGAAIVGGAVLGGIIVYRSSHRGAVRSDKLGLALANDVASKVPTHYALCISLHGSRCTYYNVQLICVKTAILVSCRLAQPAPKPALLLPPPPLRPSMRQRKGLLQHQTAGTMQSCAPYPDRHQATAQAAFRRLLKQLPLRLWIPRHRRTLRLRIPLCRARRQLSLGRSRGTCTGNQNLSFRAQLQGKPAWKRAPSRLQMPMAMDLSSPVTRHRRSHPSALRERLHRQQAAPLRT